MPIRRRSLLALALCVLLYCSQILPLLWGRSFYLDWINHVWIVQYYADHLFKGAVFPSTIDTIETFGNPQPIYYGVFFYPLAGLIAWFVGADMAMRLLCAAVLLLPLIASILALKRLTGDMALAVFLATTINSSVYQLTNLYSRSALTEFFAVQFILIGLPLIMTAITARPKEATPYIFLGGCFFALAISTHPITFYLFAFFVLPVMAILAVPLRHEIRARWKSILATMALLALVITPWVITVWKTRDGLKISTANNGLVYFPASLDSVLGVSGFFYYDPRVADAGLDMTSTPFLDAPMSISLFLVFGLMVCVFARNVKHTLYLSLPACLAAALVLHLRFPVHIQTELHQWMGPIQFAYRLSGAWILLMVTGIFASLTLLYRSSARDVLRLRGPETVIIAAAVLSLFAVVQKTSTTYLEYMSYPNLKLAALPAGSPRDSDRTLLLSIDQYRKMLTVTDRYPPTFVAQKDYSSATGYASTSPVAKPSVNLSSPSWGEPTHFSCDSDCLLTTNILLTPFNRVEIDGQLATGATISDRGTLDFEASAGQHMVTITRTGWSFLAIQTAVLITLGWFAIACIATAHALLRRLVSRHSSSVP